MPRCFGTLKLKTQTERNIRVPIAFFQILEMRSKYGPKEPPEKRPRALSPIPRDCLGPPSQPDFELRSPYP